MAVLAAVNGEKITFTKQTLPANAGGSSSWNERFDPVVLDAAKVRKGLNTFMVKVTTDENFPNFDCIDIVFSAE